MARKKKAAEGAEATGDTDEVINGSDEKATRTRKKMKFALGWVNETAAEVDEHGAEIEPSRECFVLMDLPPNIDPAQVRNRTAIERACRKAVFEGGHEEYGNKKLVVVSYGDYFEVPFEKRTVTKLCPPSEG